MSPSKTQIALRRWIVGPLLLGGLTIVLAVGFLKAFAPARLPARLPPYQGYDNAAMDAAMAPDDVRTQMDAILAFGSRVCEQKL